MVEKGIQFQSLKNQFGHVKLNSNNSNMYHYATVIIALTILLKWDKGYQLSGPDTHLCTVGLRRDRNSTSY